MQIIHEAGHVLAAWATGGTVTAVVLHPLAISRTDVSPNPSPLAVVWGGPLVGVIAPITFWLVASALRSSSTHLWRFFAGFCAIANGVYIGSGLVEPVGDAADLVRLGAPVGVLAMFGLITVPAGFALWNGLGPSFGFGDNARPVLKRHVWVTAALLAALLIAELAWSGLTGFFVTLRPCGAMPTGLSQDSEGDFAYPALRCRSSCSPRKSDPACGVRLGWSSARGGQVLFQGS